MTKRFFPGELEGNGFSKLAQVMQQAGYNKDVMLDIGIVTAPPPNISIKLKSDGLQLGKDDLIIAERLTSHSIEIDGISAQINGMGSTVSKFKGTVNNELKLGEKVIIISDESDGHFYVIDRAVNY